MALHPTGLGKGLDALIRQTQEEREISGVQMLSIDKIIPNPRQPRREFNEKALEELAASIKSQGLLQPLLVRPVGPGSPDKFEIVAGERRWRASRMIGLKELPVYIRSLSAQDTLAAALIENLQREDLNPLEEALGLQALKEEFGLSQEDMAHKLGKSRSAIANSLRLLSLPESMRPLLAEGKLSPGHARALLSITEPKAQEYLKNLILENRLSVREAEGLAAGWKEKGAFALMDLEGASLDPGAAQADGAQQEAESAGKTAAPRVKRPQSAKIMDIQNRISALFEVPVKVSGKENKGKITLLYNSEEELQALIRKLSSSVLEGETHAALPGAARQALGAEQLTPLSSPGRAELTGHGNAALDGAQHPHLEGADFQALTGENVKALDQGPSGDLEAHAAPEQQNAMDAPE